MSNGSASVANTRDPRYSLLDSKPAAEFIGMSDKTLEKDRCVRHLGIPFVKFGRKVKYRESDLKAFIDSRVVN